MMMKTSHPSIAHMPHCITPRDAQVAVAAAAAAARRSADIDMEELAHTLLQPMPLGRSTNVSLLDQSITVNNTLFIDPAKCLQSMMQALYVVKQVILPVSKALWVPRGNSTRASLRMLMKGRVSY